MSTPDILSLKWNNHKSTFLKLLSALHIKSQYEDATVACGGKLFPVHRLVLSCCSKYFEQMFAQTQGRHAIIVLKDVSAEVFESLLSYMYIGEANVKKELLSDLLATAHSLEIKGLAISDEECSPKTENSIISDSKEGTVQKATNELPKKRPLEEYQPCELEYSAKIQKLEDNTLSSSICHNKSSVTSSSNNKTSSPCQSKQLIRFSTSSCSETAESIEDSESFTTEDGQDGFIDIKEEIPELQHCTEDSSSEAPVREGGEGPDSDQTSKSEHFMNMNRITPAALMVSCTRATTSSVMPRDPSVYIPSDWNPAKQIPLFPENSTLEMFLTRSRMGSALVEAYRDKGSFTNAERSKLVALIIDGLLERFDSLRNCHFEKIAEDITVVFPIEVKETYFVGPCPEEGRRISRGKLVDRYRNQSRWRKKKMMGAVALNTVFFTP